MSTRRVWISRTRNGAAITTDIASDTRMVAMRRAEISIASGARTSGAINANAGWTSAPKVATGNVAAAHHSRRCTTARSSAITSNTASGGNKFGCQIQRDAEIAHGLVANRSAAISPAGGPNHLVPSHQVPNTAAIFRIAMKPATRDGSRLIASTGASV